MQAGLLRTLAALALATSTAGAQTSPAADVGSRVVALADTFLAARLAAFPEQATHLGGPGARHDRLRDVSAAAERAWRAQEDRWLLELRTLDARVPLGHPQWATYGLLREELESSVGHRVCENRLWTVHPLIGWQTEYSALAQQQPVGTPELREQALARWRELPRLVDAEIANLREGVRRGYTAPKVNVRAVIAGLDALLGSEPTASPFFSPAERDSTPPFRAAFERLVADAIMPAVKRYREYLAGEYLAGARTVVGLEVHPAGAACYRAAIRRYTGLDVTGEELHRLGVRELAASESTLTALAKKAYGSDNVRAVLERFRSEPAAGFSSRGAVLPAIDSLLGRVRAAVPKWFNRQPAARLIVQPFPAFQEGSAPGGQYLPPAADGSRPGVFRVNLGHAPASGARLGLEKTVFHEAVPGHHFQLSLAQERPGAHPLTRLLASVAFGEGWAVYAEQTLAAEMGLYSSTAARLGALGDAVYALATLVAETGVHAHGWTRGRAIEYLLAHTTANTDGAAAAVDRSAGWPGQALAYVVGYLEIRRLRALAVEALGERFDIRAFHDEVLGDGTITLPMLREKIEAWVRREQHAVRTTTSSILRIPGKTIEVVGLGRWTPQMIQDSMNRYSPGDSLHSHACAATLRYKLHFAEASSVIMQATDTSEYAFVAVVEPQDSSLVRHRAVRMDTTGSAAPWRPLVDLVRTRPWLVETAAIARLYGRGLRRPFVVPPSFRADSAEVRRVWTYLDEHRRPEDAATAGRILATSPNVYDRVAALAILTGFDRDDATWHALVSALLEPDGRARAYAIQLVDAFTRAVPRQVDWRPAAANLHALLDGSNLFALRDLLVMLVTTGGADPALARPLLRGGGHAVMMFAGAATPWARSAAQHFLRAVSGRDFGGDIAAWRTWLASL